MISAPDALMEETTRFLHTQIPLTQAMGVTVESYDGEQLVLKAPLGPNHNHLGTAFGGSLSAIATLAGYSLLWLLLGDRSAHIVIKESSIRYLAPVTDVICALCRKPEENAVAEFQHAFSQKGRARLRLDTQVVQDGKVCVEFTGEFVAVR